MIIWDRAAADKRSLQVVTLIRFNSPSGAPSLSLIPIKSEGIKVLSWPDFIVLCVLFLKIRTSNPPKHVANTHRTLDLVEISLLLECYLLECSSLLDEQHLAVRDSGCSLPKTVLAGHGRCFAVDHQGLHWRAATSDLLRVVIFLQGLLELARDFLEEGDLLL